MTHSSKRWLIIREGTSPESLKAKYDAGRSIRNLMDETGLSYGAVYTRLAVAGTEFRPRGGYRRTRAPKENR